MPPAPPALEFIVKCKHLFLTWNHLEPHFNSREECLAAFFQLDVWHNLAAHQPDEVSACVEYYPLEEGVALEERGYHVHGLFTYTGSFRHNITRNFNFRGVTPNYTKVSASAASIGRMLAYIKKGSGTRENPNADAVFRIGHEYEQKPSWAVALSMSSKAEAEAYIRGNFAKEWFTSGSSIRSTLDYSFRGRNAVYVSPSGYVFDPPSEVSDWVSESLVEKVCMTPRCHFFYCCCLYW